MQHVMLRGTYGCREGTWAEYTTTGSTASVYIIGFSPVTEDDDENVVWPRAPNQTQFIVLPFQKLRIKPVYIIVSNKKKNLNVFFVIVSGHFNY